MRTPDDPSLLIQFIDLDPSAPHGSSVCGRDAMLGLLETGHRLLVRSQSPWTPPIDWTDRFGDRIGAIRLAPELRRPPLRPSRSWPSHARRWAREIRDRARIGRRLRELARPALTIVNSLGTHDLRRLADPRGEVLTSLLLHESPRHFVREAERGAWHVPGWQRTLEWAIGVITTYDSCIFVSARCREEWLGLVPGLREKPTLAIPNTCNEERARLFEGRDRAGLRRELGWPEGRFVAACVASIQHRKGQDLLVDRLDELFRAVPGLFLVLVGPRASGEWTEGLIRRIDSSSHRENVLVMPSRPHAMDVVRAADAIVLPSRAEAMPLVLLEAMFLGTPVVASDVDGIPELIEDGTSGFLFSPNDPSGLVLGLARLSQSTDFRLEMADRAKKRYHENFRHELLGCRYDVAVRRLVSPSPMGRDRDRSGSTDSRLARMDSTLL